MDNAKLLKTTAVEFRRDARARGLKEREIEALVGWVVYNTPTGLEVRFPSVTSVLATLPLKKSTR